MDLRPGTTAKNKPSAAQGPQRRYRYRRSFLERRLHLRGQQSRRNAAGGWVCSIIIIIIIIITITIIMISGDCIGIGALYRNRGLV